MIISTHQHAQQHILLVNKSKLTYLFCFLRFFSFNTTLIGLRNYCLACKKHMSTQNLSDCSSTKWREKMAAPWEHERNCCELEPPKIQKGRWQMLPSYGFLLMGLWGHQGRGHFIHPAFHLEPLYLLPLSFCHRCVTVWCCFNASNSFKIFFSVLLLSSFFMLTILKNAFESHRNVWLLLWNSSVWNMRKPLWAAWNLFSLLHYLFGCCLY